SNSKRSPSDGTQFSPTLENFDHMRLITLGSSTSRIQPTSQARVRRLKTRSVRSYCELPSAPGTPNHLNDRVRYGGRMILLAKKRKMIRSRNDQEPAVGRDSKPIALLFLVPLRTSCGQVGIFVDPAVGRNDGHRRRA